MESAASNVQPDGAVASFHLTKQPPVSRDMPTNPGLGCDTSWCSPGHAYLAPTSLGGTTWDYFTLGRGPIEAHVNAASTLGPWPAAGQTPAPVGCASQTPSVAPGHWTTEPESDTGDLFSPVSNSEGWASQTEPKTPPEAVALARPAHTKRPSWSAEPPAMPSPPQSIRDPPDVTRFRRSKTKPPAQKHGIQLRTAARRARKCSPAASATTSSTRLAGGDTKAAGGDDLTAEERRARHNHNLVEKHYRKRLNLMFERLLGVLPIAPPCAAAAADDRADGDGIGARGGRPGGEKRISKAEVLELAACRIEELESERHELLREKKELLRSMEVLMAGAVGGPVLMGCHN